MGKHFALPDMGTQKYISLTSSVSRRRLQTQTHPHTNPLADSIPGRDYRHIHQHLQLAPTVFPTFPDVGVGRLRPPRTTIADLPSPPTRVLLQSLPDFRSPIDYQSKPSCSPTFSSRPSSQPVPPPHLPQLHHPQPSLGATITTRRNHLPLTTGKPPTSHGAQRPAARREPST